MNKFVRKLVAFLLFAGIGHTAGFAAEPNASADLALYQGADRHARLLEAAKKEGELMVYHVYQNLPVITSAFSKKYGIKVKHWRAGSEAVMHRALTEAAGGKYEVDIVQTMAPETEALRREKLLQEVRSPYHKDLIPQATPAHKEWVGFATNVFVAAYNTDKVKKEELPKTYADLLHPRWKGRLGIEVDNHMWFGSLIDAMGGQQGLKLFSDIAATNGISTRKGHALLNNMVGSGEVPLALTVFIFMPEQLKQKGAPIDALTLSPVIALFSTIGMPKKAPNRAAALLFYDFMLSDEGQQLLADTAFVPTSKKVQPPSWHTKAPLTFVDPVRALDMNEKWQKTWEETVTKRGGQK